MSLEDVGKLFKIGEFSGEIGAVGHALTRLIDELKEASAPADILDSLIIARRNVVDASALSGVWAEQISRI